MTAYLIRRFSQCVFLLILVTLIVFMGMRLLPGDPIFMYLSSAQVKGYTEEQVQELRHEYGLDRSLVVQYIDWLTGIFRGDFGESISQHTSPLQLVAYAAPITLNISLLAFVISLIIGIPAGIICAVRRGTWIDTMVTILANIGITIPIFWLGIILIYLFSLTIHLLPVQGYTSPFVDLGKNIRQLIMPVFCLAVFPISAIARQTRSSMLEVMRQDYIRTAWSKGIKERAVVMRHALKNSLIPVVTLSGLGLSNILGGSVLIEMVFNINGMGLRLMNAVLVRDYPVVQCFIFFIAIFVLLGNFAVDVSYGWLDPRIRYE